MDTNTFEKIDLESELTLINVREQIDSVDRYDRHELDELAKELTATYGEGAWKKTALKSSNNRESAFAIWSMIKRLVTPHDLGDMADFLSRDCVSGEIDRSVKEGLIRKIAHYAEDCPLTDRDRVKNALKLSQKKILELVSEEFRTDGLYAAELVREDMFNLIKARLLYEEKDSVIADIDLEDPGYGKYFLKQLDLLKKEVDPSGIKRLRYRMNPVASYGKDHKNDPHLDHLDRAYREYLEKTLESHDEYKHSQDSEALPPGEVSGLVVEKVEVAIDQVEGNEASKLALRFFAEDMKYMRDQINSWAITPPARRLEMEIRALIIKNPGNKSETPIILIRPDLEFDSKRKYHNGDGAAMFHYDIWGGVGD